MPAKPVVKRPLLSAEAKTRITGDLSRVFGFFNWRTLEQILLVFIGALVSAFGYVAFQVPFNIAAGGFTGLSIVINKFVTMPLGTLFFLLNLPILLIGFFYLGRWRFLFFTLFAVIIFSAAVDVFQLYLSDFFDPWPVTNDMLLASIYGGVVSGLGIGLINKAGGTPGGTIVIGRILQQRTGLSLAQSMMYTDSAIIVAAGLVFQWEAALHAFLVVYIMGLSSDFVMEGPSTIRTAFIVTDKAEEVAYALRLYLKRNVSIWEIRGGYSGGDHSLVYCTVYRPQVNDLKHILKKVDAKAFVTIGHAHQALGAEFVRIKGERQKIVQEIKKNLESSEG